MPDYLKTKCKNCGYYGGAHNDRCSESSLNDGLKVLVIAILQEARSKHLIDCLHDDYLNDDFHVEVTLTVGEIAAAAKVLGIDDF